MKTKNGPRPPDRPTPPVLCPLCLNLPDLVADPIELFLDGTGDHQYYLTSPCHPGEGIVPEYCTTHRTLTLICARCDRPVIAFQLQSAFKLNSPITEVIQ